MEDLVIHLFNNEEIFTNLRDAFVFSANFRGGKGD